MIYALVLLSAFVVAQFLALVMMAAALHDNMRVTLALDIRVKALEARAAPPLHLVPNPKAKPCTSPNDC